MKISWKGQEVQDPLARMVISGGFVVIGIPLLVVSLPVWIPLHFALKAMDRKGFFRGKEIIFDISSFSRA